MDGKLCFLPAAILVGLICACSGGDSVSPGTPTSPPTPTPRQVSQADLPNMALTSADLGPARSSFVVNSDKSGPQARNDVINDACDPQKRASELDATQWVASYNKQYDPASGASSSSDGVFAIGSTVDLFQDDKGAAAAFQDMIADMLQEANAECQGVSVGRVEKFEMPTIGDESWGGELHATVPNGAATISIVITTAAYRQGQLVANAMIARFGDTGVPDEAVRLAKALAQRTS